MDARYGILKLRTTPFGPDEAYGASFYPDQKSLERAEEELKKYGIEFVYKGVILNVAKNFFKKGPELSEDSRVLEVFDLVKDYKSMKRNSLEGRVVGRIS